MSPAGAFRVKELVKSKEIPLKEIAKKSPNLETDVSKLDKRVSREIDGKEEDNISQERGDDSGAKRYLDDNNNEYRVGDDLKPNSQYELNGYRYQTDAQSRVKSVEGMVHLKDRDERLPIRDPMEAVGKGDQLEGDDRGHLIADQFDGPNGLENLIPQDADINRGAYKNFENEIAKEVKDGKEVYIKVEPIYEGDSHRPDALTVTCSVNGDIEIKIFPNQPKEAEV